ncbi:integral membrane protein [[Actinomadura] parvosata subsp. kistnae]|uniref:hypothetical protein n=1 Tax=[Actinomadura] parvosata TaxID=1955412 RepID=UPI000D2CBB8B|nr:hypothetical protein [Nonomuraea sp. ATCC 55076]SPL91172.1 integral membrane protein [Actinomadura parvosata subsp. kistnae]
MSARRDLGPEFEDAVVESFLDKMGQEIDRRVDERLARSAPKAALPVINPNVADGQRLALAIVSLVLGTGATLAFVLTGNGAAYVVPIWIGIIIVNVIFNANRHKG